MDVYTWLLIAVMLVGVAGTFVPTIPGFWIIFLSILAYGVFDHWSAYPVWYALIIGAMAVGSLFLDYYAPSIFAKRYGASEDSSLGSALGSAVCSFIGKGHGAMIGATLGSVGAEYKAHHSLKEAVRASTGSYVGMAVASFIQFIFALIVFVITLVFLWGLV